MFSIYKCTNNVNNKVYIGYTENFDKRIEEHRTLYKFYNFVFYKAIKKYGWNNFKWEIIYMSKDKEHCKNVMERYYIKEYNSYIGFKDSNGYNMTLGGEGNTGPKSEEHKRKISLSKTGKKRTEEEKRNISLSRSKQWCLKSTNGDSLIVNNL